jgi:hypothetical protein
LNSEQVTTLDHRERLDASVVTCSRRPDIVAGGFGCKAEASPWMQKDRQERGLTAGPFVVRISNNC